MAEAALAFGSNLGDSRGMIQTALARLAAIDGLDLLKVSSFYRTPPWGVEDQPDFVNACAMFDTALSPEDLLDTCKQLETELGREEGVRWGPRLIDIDILWMDGEVRESEKLTLPHPRMLERAFVLVPLADVAPGLRIGGLTIGERVSAMARDHRGQVSRLDT